MTLTGDRAGGGASNVNERVQEALRLVHEHLNAVMIMVPLDAPVHSSGSVGDVLDYLERNGFDVASTPLVIE